MSTEPPKHGIKRPLQPITSNDINSNSTPTASTQTSATIPAVTVIVRVRPPNEREKELAKSSSSDDLSFFTLSDTSKDITLDSQIHDKSNWFRFDQVYGVEADQDQLFTDSAKPIVEACLQGYNATILAYGQTGSGMYQILHFFTLFLSVQ
jgi:hypothetical protein